MPNEIQYAAFLIRWQDGGSQTRWRATVENAYTGQKLHFSNKSKLLRFLWQSLYKDEISDPSGVDAQEDA